MISGLSAHFKLKSLPAEEPFVIKVDEAPATDISAEENVAPLDNAEEEQKEEEEEKKDTEDNEQ